MDFARTPRYHREVAFAKQLARLFAREIRMQEALCGVVTNVARRGHGDLTIATRLATFAMVPVKRLWMALKPVSKGLPWA